MKNAVSYLWDVTVFSNFEIGNYFIFHLITVVVLVILTDYSLAHFNTDRNG